MSSKTFHFAFGSYGIIHKSGRLLVIKKNDGPYINRYDLPGGQHGLYQLSKDKNGENILLYDNNVDVTNGNKKTSGKYSQAVQYHIDTKKMTIDQTWAYGKSLGKTNFTNIIGYAERESNGNTLVDFGYKNNSTESNVIEVDSSGNQVFNVTVKNASSKAYVYRAYRLEFYPQGYVFDVNK